MISELKLNMNDKMEEYLFDLHGDTILEHAIDEEHLQSINSWLDALPPLEVDQWLVNIDVHF